MSAAIEPRSFADTIFARLIALAIAVLIAAILYVNWGKDIRNLASGNVPALPVLGEQAPVQTVNPGLQNCLESRVGDVDKMKADGVINDAQYASFRQRAEQLCRAQHPG
jgi:hypothetical protein